MNYETTPEIEVAVARYFNSNALVIVPNVSWGLLRYEADMLLLTRSGYAWEVEIKVSRADLLRDKKKKHQHDSPKVKRLWFAIPECLTSSIDDIPERAGVLVVDGEGYIKPVRQPVPNPDARKLSQSEQFQLARLGALRIWSLKSKLCIA